MQWKGRSRFLLTQVQEAPIRALKLSTRGLCGQSLDIDRTTFSKETGDQQDWVGLGELMGFENYKIQKLAKKSDRTMDLLEDWSTKSNATVGLFIAYLERMERFDLLEEDMFQTKVLHDVDKYHESVVENERRIVSQPLQVPEVSSGFQNMDYEHENPDMEFKGITVNEVETGQPEFFDAFVCATGEDMLYVKQMITVLEGHYGLKLCIKDRDLIPGVASYTVLAHLIEKRCNKMIIVLSPKYLQSSECDFMTKFGHSLSPGARSKKLIPVLIESPVLIPDILRFIALVDYTKCELVEWFWRRLARALQECSSQYYSMNKDSPGSRGGDTSVIPVPAAAYSYPNPTLLLQAQTSAMGELDTSTPLYNNPYTSPQQPMYTISQQPLYTRPGSPQMMYQPPLMESSSARNFPYHVRPAGKQHQVPGYVPMDPSLIPPQPLSNTPPTPRTPPPEQNSGKCTKRKSTKKQKQ